MLSWEPPVGFNPTMLQMSESAVQHSTHCATRVLRRRGRQSLTRCLPHYSPLFISDWPLVCLGPAHNQLSASQLPGLAANSSHSQLTHSPSYSPALTLSWVSIHSDIPGRNNAVQSVRSQRRDLLTPSVMWASSGIRAHAAANVWVSHSALNPPCH